MENRDEKVKNVFRTHTICNGDNLASERKLIKSESMARFGRNRIGSCAIVVTEMDDGVRVAPFTFTRVWRLSKRRTLFFFVALLAENCRVGSLYLTNLKCGKGLVAGRLINGSF